VRHQQKPIKPLALSIGSDIRFAPARDRIFENMRFPVPPWFPQIRPASALKIPHTRVKINV